ncbi:MAG: winged helix-turn-helix domain-containing protein [Planctomycetota bacterium]
MYPFRVASDLTTRCVRRLALCRAGLLKPEWSGYPTRAPSDEAGARAAAHRVIERLGYLQLDTVSVAGARTHGLVLLSRLKGLDPSLAERLLAPEEPLFEYWGHEACWMPIEAYPIFRFRREEFARRKSWRKIMDGNEAIADRLRRRIRDEGPLRSKDMQGEERRWFWSMKVTRLVAMALWWSGELAIRERRSFQRSFDLAERVVPARLRRRCVKRDDAIDALLLKALDGHGWAGTRTLADTFRLSRTRDGVAPSLERLVAKGRVVACDLLGPMGRKETGWIRPEDLELAARLRRVRPRVDRGVLLSPFDPVLWDRERVRQLFDFDQVLEIYKPAAKRKYGYYCLPVLAGERLVGRVDLKANRKAGQLHLLSCRFEEGGRRPAPADREAARSALERHAGALGLELTGRSV